MSDRFSAAVLIVFVDPYVLMNPPFNSTHKVVLYPRVGRASNHTSASPLNALKTYDMVVQSFQLPPFGPLALSILSIHCSAENAESFVPDQIGIFAKSSCLPALISCCSIAAFN